LNRSVALFMCSSNVPLGFAAGTAAAALAGAGVAAAGAAEAAGVAGAAGIAGAAGAAGAESVASADRAGRPLTINSEKARKTVLIRDTGAASNRFMSLLNILATS
jgi:hypothetical protein